MRTVPVYSFLRGDCLGLIVLVDENHTIAELARRTQRAAAVRVAPTQSAAVYFAGERLAPDLTIIDAGLGPLDRVDVVPEDPDNER